MTRGKIIVTGATGYIGTRVVDALVREGWSPEAWTRTPPQRDVAWQRYALTDLTLASLERATAVIHLAADTSGVADAEVELHAAKRLADAARAAGVRLIFASSQTALNPGSAYGRAKRDVEALVADAQGVSARLGLVFGRRRLGGVFATLVETTRRLPVIPAILPAPRVQPIHVDDVAEAFVRILDRPQLRGVVHLGDGPVAFHAFLGEIVRRRHARAALFAPIPRLFLAPVLAVAPRAIRERAHSLLSLAPMPHGDSKEMLGLDLRSWRNWLGASITPMRRDLLREGRALLRYAGGGLPGPALTARYARAIETLSDGAPLGLSNTVCSNAWLLGLLEKPNARGRSALETRLDWALTLAEATPEGALAFERAPAGFMSASVDVGAAVAAELARRTLGPVARLLFSAS